MEGRSLLHKGVAGSGLLLIALIVSLTPAAGVKSTRHGGPKLVPAAAGDLDPAFGSGGKATAAVGLSFSNAIATQPDGKILVLGYNASSGTLGDTSLEGATIVRFDANGSLDSTFGSNGIVTLGSSPAFTGFAIAVQQDGKIVLGGTGAATFDMPGPAELVRLSSSGSLDASFGSGGVASVPASSAIFLSIAIQADGKIVAAGPVPGSSPGGILSRFNSDGSLDSGFATAGSLFLAGNVIFATRVQPDGKIVVGGGTTKADEVIGGAGISVQRFNADGSPDTNFGTGGATSTSIEGAGGVALDLAIQPDGKIVAVGIPDPNNTTIIHFVVVRYTATGSLDTSFGGSGIVTTAVAGTADIAEGVAIQADGKIVVAGASFSVNAAPAAKVIAQSEVQAAGLFLVEFLGDPGSVFSVVRYNVDGSLDSSFGSGGKVTTSFFGNGSGAAGVAIQPDNDIVVAGAVVATPGGATSGQLDFAVARYLAGRLVGDFSVSSSQSSQTVGLGSSATFMISGSAVAGSSPPAGPINLSASVTPSGSGITASFLPPSIALGGQSTLTVSVPGSSATGSYTVAVTAVDGFITHTTNLSVNVTSGPDFSIGFNPSSISAQAGTKARAVVQINRINGFSGNVTITPPGPVSGIRPKPAGPEGTTGSTAVFKLKIGGGVTAGTYPLTFTAQDDSGRTRTAVLNLIVQ